MTWMYGFPEYGDVDCEHPRRDRKDVGYMVVCQRCGAPKTFGEWRPREIQADR